MFGLGGTEVLVLFVLALLVFGPRKLPEIGQMLGKTMSELRRATMDFRTSLEREVQLDKLREAGDSLRREVALTEPNRPAGPRAPDPGPATPPVSDAPSDRESRSDAAGSESS